MPFGLLSVFQSILLGSVLLCGTKRANIAEFSSNNFLSCFNHDLIFFPSVFYYFILVYALIIFKEY